MILGEYRFIADRGCLQHLESSATVTLTRSELIVLGQLAEKPGITLSKKELSFAGTDSAQISESAVVKAVFTLRQTLGDAGAHCLHTIPKEGYQLLPSQIEDPSELEPTSRRLPRTFVKGMQILSLLAVVVVSMLFFWRTSVSNYEGPPITAESIAITNHSGQKISLDFVTSSQANIAEMKRYGDVLAQHITQCEYSQWQRVKIALSHDQQMLNITLFSLASPIRIRNMKISDFRARPEFISANWLKEVKICE
ncbi:winged helix-turn-helix domain-containing protein [Ferrimonas aestuarii]|uniref:Helix-turn-helix domain-containing protein n=1 Tax=Ferrimonas aestuarii TaxID=2569539 RepID=A0A4U1BW41_9GAMM|nr:helix-turn-helix domain-containing protein [Ferrimonas aestuarii]TKB57399.1 helix-turn-helix domain-containing protein [Ferrimonas aestuarii]